MKGMESEQPVILQNRHFSFQIFDNSRLHKTSGLTHRIWKTRIRGLKLKPVQPVFLPSVHRRVLVTLQTLKYHLCSRP